MIDHPMTPTDEQLAAISDGRTFHEALKKAYTDGADAELQAIERWFLHFYHTETWMNRDLKTLREERRPKPPSLKQQALIGLEELVGRCCGHYIGPGAAQRIKTIRKALEAIPDD
jgi:hypothetical protein